MTKNPLRPIRPCWLTRAHWTADETCREYERVVDAKHLDQIRAEAKQFSNKRLWRQSGVGRSAIMNFKRGRNTIKPRTLRKLTRAIHALQNKNVQLKWKSDIR